MAVLAPIQTLFLSSEVEATCSSGCPAVPSAFYHTVPFALVPGE